MEHTVTFRQGESAPFPVCFDCEAGMDPVPVVIGPDGEHFPLMDGDEITYRVEVLAVISAKPEKP